MGTSRLLRTAAAAALLIGGLVHLDLYFHGYRSMPDANLGRSFLLNAIASGLLAVLVLVRKEWWIRLAGIAMAVSTLGAFAASRRGNGILGLREQGLQPSPQALIALIAEIAVIVLLGLTFIPSMADDPSATDGKTSPGPWFLMVAAGGTAALMIAFGAFWAHDAGSSKVVAAAGPSAVTIKDFAFGAGTLTVSKGATVTWTNADPFGHSVVSNDKSFMSEKLQSGTTFQHTFDTAGTFTYICGIHPSMTGTVVVNG